MPQPTRDQVTHALAESMREFGYPDTTDEMAGQILDAFVKDHEAEMPHGVIGMFLHSQLTELSEAGVDLSRLCETEA